MNNTINRLIIIGNGFDLAHGMKTKYKDFVNGYLRQRIESCFEKGATEDLVKIEGEPKNLSVYKEYLNLKALLAKSKIKNGLDQDEKMLLMILYEKLPRQFKDKHPTINDEIIWRYVPDIVKDCKDNEIHLTQGIIQLIEKQKVYPVSYTLFFKEVYDEIENKNWVDIEYAYYDYLCGLMKKLDLSDEKDVKEEVSEKIDELNEEMKFITKKLKEYLAKEDGTFEENSRRVNNEILDKMMMPLSEQEIAVEALELWDSFVKENSHKKLQPDKIWILNFNYTSLIQRYYEEITKKPRYNQKEMRSYLNYIHGSLYGKEEIIFGYGDDSGEMYKRLSDKNDNRLLENDKTVKYLGSFWYRNFFGFIESAPFQVYIMGHSCGISDRTLLSTIFQHENCVSIKPYYHEKENSDDYYEIIKNISRCFDDKKLMRDRVVNKEFCEPLPQPVEKE